MARRLEDLPERPARPHPFFSLERRSVSVRVPGHPRPVQLSWVEAGSGPPLVLVHGLMTSAYSFRYVMAALAERYRVIAVDLPGAGHSGADVELSMAPAAVASVLEAFFAALGLERIYLAGNSLGGYLALWYATLHPERIDRLVVMHAPGFPEPRLYALRAALSVPGAARLVSLLARNPEAFVMKNVHYADASIMSREEAREYAAIFRDPARTRVFARVLKESMDPSQMRALHARLRPFRAPFPILLLWAREDALVNPEFGPRYLELLPGARLEWVEEASHFIHVDQPERAAQALIAFGRP